MKKLFSSLCVFAILCLLAFSGCSDGWTEVQSITYYISPSRSQTLRSYEEEHTLKIRFLENNCLEISYWEYSINPNISDYEYEKKSIKIFPLSYQIDYYID